MFSNPDDRRAGSGDPGGNRMSIDADDLREIAELRAKAKALAAAANGS